MLLDMLIFILHKKKVVKTMGRKRKKEIEIKEESKKDSITNTIYNGEVNITFKLDNKVISRSKYKNSGTILLKKAFSMFMCGGEIANIAQRYLPTKIDLRISTTAGTSDEYSFLKRTLPISSPAYQSLAVTTTAGNEDTYSVLYSASIPQSALSGDVPGNINHATLYLMCDYPEEIQIDENNSYTTSDLASISLELNKLESLEPGITMLVE